MEMPMRSRRGRPDLSGIAEALPNGGLTETLQMIDISLIDPNPWEARLTMDEDRIRSLADNIFAIGQNDAILVRPTEGGRYQRSYGQRRQAALGKLHELKWETDTAGAKEKNPERRARPNPVVLEQHYDGETTWIWARVREMTDEEVILNGISENLQRESLSWIEESRALERALEQKVGGSLRGLARAVGLSPTNLSHRMTVLKMPEAVHKLIEEEKLGWTSARLLAPFIANDHVHHDELERCAQQMAQYGESISAGQVRQLIWVTLEHFRDRWRRVRTGGRVWDAYPSVDHEPPAFDVEAFEERNSSRLHRFASLDEKDDVWTCKASAWIAEQHRAVGEPVPAPQLPTPAPVMEEEAVSTGNEQGWSDVQAPVAEESPQPFPVVGGEVERGDAAQDGFGLVPVDADAPDVDYVVIDNPQCTPLTVSTNIPHYHVEWTTPKDSAEGGYMWQSPVLFSREEATRYVEAADWFGDEGVEYWVCEHTLLGQIEETEG